MKHIQIIPKAKQQEVALFEGRFVENKPIPFPERGRTQAYSNLFYWAHLVALEDGEFPLHEHRGFEIFTFMLKGSLEHYDTATEVWTALEEGGMQVIQANSGVSHAERISKGSELFQIWFDPDFSQSLRNAPKYTDYTSEYFSKQRYSDKEEIRYIDLGSSCALTKNISIKKISYKEGKHDIMCHQNSICSVYVLKGRFSYDSDELEANDFLIVEDENSLEIDVKKEMQAFIIETPLHIRYARFMDRYQE